LVSTGSISTDGDDRIRLTNIVHDLRNRSTKTFSFDPQTGMCNSCLAGPHAAWAAAAGGPVVLVVSDQNFPACVPARTAGKECLRIIRCEDSSLQDLTHALLDTLGKARLPKNSVVLLGSLSHLCTSGTEHYLADWVRSRWWIRERLGEDISVLPLAPIWSEGLTGKSQIRNMVETLTWFTSLKATEAVLMKDTFAHIIEQHLTCRTGPGWVPERLCFRLPAGLDTRAVAATVSEGWNSLPESVPSLSKAAEKDIVNTLLAMLNDAFEANLDLDPCLSRDITEINEQRAADTADKLILVIGSSHAANVVHALELQGANVRYLTDRGWKLSVDSINQAVNSLTEMECTPDLILIQVLDNNTFFVAKEDGTLSLPVKGKDKKFHVAGELRVATKEQMSSVLKTLKPLLDALPSVPKAMILPVPRYCYKKCCSDETHVTNFGDNLANRIKSGLGVVKKTVRSFLFREKYTGIRIIDPYSVVSSLGSDRYADPVHLIQAGYDDLASHVLGVLAGTVEGDKPADPPSTVQNTNKRIRILSMGSGRGSVRGRGDLNRGRAGQGGRPWQIGGRGHYGKPRTSL
jgi:hypothetical protein